MTMLRLKAGREFYTDVGTYCVGSERIINSGRRHSGSAGEGALSSHIWAGKGAKSKHTVYREFRGRKPHIDESEDKDTRLPFQWIGSSFMTSRTRVVRTLEHHTPDRVPRSLWRLPGIEMFRPADLD